MELQIPDIETVYALKPRSIIKSKYFYIITSGSRSYRLYPFTQTPEEAEKLYALNKAVYSGGVSVCPIIPTADGDICSFAEESAFLLTLVPKGREPSIDDSKTFLQMTALAADFHRELKRNAPVGTCTITPYEKGLNTLSHIKSIINRKNKLSEIDKMFSENYAAVRRLAENSLNTLESCALPCTYAYGNLKEENFIQSINKLTLTNWNNLKISHFLADLAYMIKRYNKKSADHSVTTDDIIACYTERNPLSQNELTALKSMLAYPEKYISILREYYGKHRPFAPLYVKEKLQKELKNMQNRA